MSVINTNYLSLVAQNNLQKSQSALGTAIERLSSGLRINSAKDDAAGQAIANRMGAQINGLNQAARNANDGISAAQTTEGALNQINDNLQRIRVLTVQASNGTNSGEDLTSIQNEIGQRLQEINRISSETEFNGVKVLASDTELSIQVGANDGQTIKVNLQEINVGKLNLNGFNVDGSGTPNQEATLQSLKASGFTQVGTTNEYKATGFNTATTVADVFENLEDGAKVIQDPAGTPITYTYDADADTFSFDRTKAAGLAADLGLTPSAGESTTIKVKLGAQEVNVSVASSGALSNADTGEDLYLTGAAGTKNLSVTDTGATGVATITDLVTELGLAARAAGTGSITTSAGTVYTSNADAGTLDTTGEIVAAETLKNQMAAVNATTYGVEIGTTEYFVAADNSITIGDSAAATPAAPAYTSGFAGDSTISGSADASVYVNDNGKITDGAANVVYANAEGELTMDAVSGATKTENPLDVLDAALATVDALRSDLGAIQNRFESAITNLQTTSNNLAAAQSRIQDADYSVEVANMTRAQILQQAGTSVLAQANQIPQGVLSLLR